jgi:hypothetical protein
MIELVQQNPKIQFLISFWLYVNMYLIATNFCSCICICGLYPNVLLPVLWGNVRLTVVMSLIAVHKLICTCCLWTYSRIAVQLLIVWLCMWLNLLRLQMGCVVLCLELVGYRCVYLPISLATMIFRNLDSTLYVLSCQFIVNLIGCVWGGRMFSRTQAKFSHNSLCSLALASGLIMERKQNVMGIQE